MLRSLLSLRSAAPVSAKLGPTGRVVWPKRAVSSSAGSRETEPTSWVGTPRDLVAVERMTAYERGLAWAGSIAAAAASTPTPASASPAALRSPQSPPPIVVVGGRKGLTRPVTIVPTTRAIAERSAAAVQPGTRLHAHTRAQRAPVRETEPTSWVGMPREAIAIQTPSRQEYVAHVQVRNRFCSTPASGDWRSASHSHRSTALDPARVAAAPKAPGAQLQHMHSSPSRMIRETEPTHWVGTPRDAVAGLGYWQPPAAPARASKSRHLPWGLPLSWVSAARPGVAVGGRRASSIRLGAPTTTASPATSPPGREAKRWVSTGTANHQLAQHEAAGCVNGPTGADATAARAASRPANLTIKTKSSQLNFDTHVRGVLVRPAHTD